MQNQLLLLEDIENLARKGEIVTVKPGFARNYLLPKKKAVVVDKRTVRMQEQLKKEREKQAIEDKKASEALSKELAAKTFEVKVKVDPDGHMYGSVAQNDIVKLLANEGFEITRRNVKMLHAIKTLGIHEITLQLKEGIEAKFALKVSSENPLPKSAEKKPAPKKEEVAKEEVAEEAAAEEPVEQ